MQILRILLTVLSSVSLTFSASVDSAAPSGPLDHSTTIYYWPLSAPSPATLAKVNYNPTNFHYEVVDYSPPSVDKSSPPESDTLTRVGLYNPSTKAWSGSVTSISSFQEAYHGLVTLHLDDKGEAWHAGFHASARSSATDGSNALKVDIVKPTQGPRPHLNKPVVLSPEGKLPEPPEEKSFFQKYWWVFLAISVLAMAGSGEK